MAVKFAYSLIGRRVVPSGSRVNGELGTCHWRWVPMRLPTSPG